MTIKKKTNKINKFIIKKINIKTNLKNKMKKIKIYFSQKMNKISKLIRMET
jgi:hypothetical protein